MSNLKKNTKKELINTLAFSSSQSKNTPLRFFLFFLFRFLALFILFELAYTNSYFAEHIFLPINKMFAFLGAKTLSLLGISAQSTGDIISSSAFSISIRQGCDSMEALAIFISGVIAFPSKLRIKFLGLALGTLIIFFFNLVRIVHLFWIGLYHNEYFELFHIEIWQVLFIALALGLWHLWKLKAFKD